MKTFDTKNAQALHKQRLAMYVSADKYRSTYIDSRTGLFADRYLEQRPCPVCKGTDLGPLFTKNGGNYVACQECGMVFLNPVFKHEALADYYRNNTTAQATAHANESDFYRNIYSSGLQQIASIQPQGRLLDIGCSSGLFLDVAREQGYATYGVELNCAEATIAQNKGHTIWNTPIDSVPTSVGFNAIALWDVFEHIKDGGSYLINLKRYLTERGILFLQIPNAGALAARVMREKCNMFDGLEHVNLYSHQTLDRVAKAAGYQVLSIISVIDELKPIRNFLNYEDPYYGKFLENEEFRFLTSDLIHTNLLGYKLQVVLSPLP